MQSDCSCWMDSRCLCWGLILRFSRRQVKSTNPCWLLLEASAKKRASSISKLHLSKGICLKLLTFYFRLLFEETRPLLTLKCGGSIFNKGKRSGQKLSRFLWECFFFFFLLICWYFCPPLSFSCLKREASCFLRGQVITLRVIREALSDTRRQKGAWQTNRWPGNELVILVSEFISAPVSQKRPSKPLQFYLAPLKD